MSVSPKLKPLQQLPDKRAALKAPGAKMTSSSSSMLYTMGMALDRAQENGLNVRVLVDGSWLEGNIAAYDGVGLVLESPDGQHSVVRSERIAAVTVCAESPYRAPIESGDYSRPMPGPRGAYATV